MPTPSSPSNRPESNYSRYSTWKGFGEDPVGGLRAIFHDYTTDFRGTCKKVGKDLTSGAGQPDPHYQQLQRNNLKARYHHDPDYLQDTVELSPRARSGH